MVKGIIDILRPMLFKDGWNGIVSKLFVLKICFILLAILMDALIPDHIPSDDVERFHFQASSETSRIILTPFVKWDAAYFHGIARDGYQEEKYFAFFPLYPFLIRSVALVIWKILPFPIVTFDEMIIISAILISNISHILYVYFLRSFLTNVVKQDIDIQMYITIAALNPALVFFTTAYTESLYALVTLLAFISLKERRALHAGVFLLLASFTRSNGLFNAIITFSILKKPLISLKQIYVMLFLWFCCGFPFIAFNYSAHEKLCSNHDICSSAGLLGFFSTYANIQAKYWSVGFLKYFTFKQIPNFILAAPMVWIDLKFIILKIKETSNLGNMKISTACQLFHLAIVLAVGVFLSNVQICTRLLMSSSPLTILALHDYYRKQPKITSVYIVSYVILGFLLHVNFFPWT